MVTSNSNLASHAARGGFRMSKTFLAVFVALVMVTSTFVAMAAVEPEPEIWPSKDAYVDGQQVVIYGINWESTILIEIALTHPDFPAAFEYDVLPLEDGTFEFSEYYATGVVQFDIPVTVTATQTLADGTVLEATTTFFDPAVLLEGYTLEPHPTWTTGVIKGYNEGDSAPYKVTLAKKFFADPDESNPETVNAQIWMAHDTLAIDREHHGVDYYTEYPEETGPFNIYGPTATPFSVIDGDGVIVDQYLVAENDEQFDDRFGVFLLVWYFELEFGEDDVVTVGWGAHLALTCMPDYLGASWWPGASLHGEIYDMQPEPDSGDRDSPIDVVGMLMPPEMTLDKVGDKDVMAEGETITFTISWSNVGQDTAYDLVLTDTVPYVLNIDETSFLTWTSDAPTPVSVSPTIVANEITYEVDEWPGTGDDGEDPILTGYLSFEAVVDMAVPGDYLNQVTLSYTDDHWGYYDTLYDDWPFCIVAEPDVEITKTGVDYAHVGDTIEYSYYVENVGDTDLTIDVVDDVLGTIATGLFLAAGTATTLTEEYLVDTLPVDYQIVNIVTATGEDQFEQTDTDTDTWTVEILAPELWVAKEADPQCAQVGEEVWYTISYFNPSFYTVLYDVHVSDSLLGTWDIGTLMPREGDDIVISLPAIENDPNPDGEMVNTVEAWGFDLLGLRVDASDEETVNIYHPMIEITKTANLECAEPGETVLFWITVTNPSSDTPMYAVVSDPMISLDPLFEDWLQPGQMKELGPFEVTVPRDVELLTNTATVDAKDIQEHHVIEESSWTVEIYHPAIGIDKYADKDVAAPGDTVNYYVYVWNPSHDATMTAYIYDPMIGVGILDSIELAPGGDHEFGPYPIEMPESPDPVVNLAYVWAYDHQKHDEYAEDTWTVDLVYPGIEIDKWSKWECAEEGETVEYYFDVTNTGDVVLDYEVSDPLLGGVIESGTLDPFTSIVLGPHSYVVPEDCEWVENTATVVAEDEYGHEMTAESSWTIEIFHPAIGIDKYADKDVAAPGDTVNYYIYVWNPSHDATMTADVYDPMFGVGPIGSIVLLPGEGHTFGPYPIEMPESPDPVVNLAYVEAKDHQEHDERAEDTWTVDLIHPGIEIDKWSKWECAEEGETVEYYFDVTNTGDVALDYEVSDPLLGGVIASGTLDPYQSVTLGPFEYTIPVDCEWVENTATVVAEDEYGHEMTAESSWTIEIFHPAIGIDKYADKTMAHPGDTITYYIYVWNPSHDATMTAEVYDPMFGVGPIGSIVLLPGEGHTFGPFTYTVLEGEQVVTNLAYVEAEDHQEHDERAEDEWSVEIVYPDIDVEKTGPEYASAGDIITYTVTVTNTGDTTLYNVEVWDSLAGLVATYAELAVGEFDTFTYTYEVPPGEGTLDNTVTADGYDYIGGYVCDEDTWTVIKYGEVSGFKRADLNRDGVASESEPGLMNWVIELYGILDEGGTDIRTTSTDSNGYFEFTMLKPGVYTISEVMQTGWTAYTSTSYEFTVGSGMAFEYSFGNMPDIEICGYKWEDTNINGIWDPDEFGIEGWTIYLEGGQIPPGEPLVAVTDEYGYYCFSDLLPGVYYVTEETRVGWYAVTSITVEVVVSELEPFDRDVNFGNAMYGSITGFKWLDEYMNGYKDGNEVFLEGWVIWIEGTLANGEPYGPYSTTTDVNGVYVFTDLLPGEYTVWEELLEGWINITPWTYDVTIDEASYVHCAKFGNVELGSINGWKFLDWDMDGFMDGDEPGIPGWEITLTGWLNDGYWPWAPNGATTVGPITVITDEYGYWEFTGLLPGIYTVTEASVDLWYHVTDPSVTLWVASGTDVPDVKFGNVPYFCFEVYKFDDLDGDGEWDPEEPGLEGWEIRINGLQNDRVPVDITLVTDETGFAATCFVMLPGSYVIEEVMQNGWIATIVEAYKFTIPMCLEPSRFVFEFGNFKLGMIFGYKYEDMDGDGVLDPEDLPIEGWEISLHAPDGSITTTVTDEYGYYEFVGLSYGLYTVEEETRPEWLATTPTSHDRLVTSGAHIEVPVFLNYMYGCISGYKWNDLDGDGIWDPEEPGIERWPIYLDSNGILDESEDELTYTDGDGFYSFCMLTAGTYTVYEIVPDGWIATTVTSYTVEITSGVHVEDRNFGNFQKVMLTLFKFNDLWGDGSYDGEDYGLEGWEITVSGPGVPSGSVMVLTDEFGYAYVWVDAAGTYTVTEEDRAGWCHTTPAVVYVDVTSGQAMPSAYVEFGNFECVDITIFKFEDVNGNGVFDNDDVPIEGWEIYAADEYTGEELWLYTNADGLAFIHVCTGGLWAIAETPVEGWTQTLPADDDHYVVLVTSGMAVNADTQMEQYYYEFGNFECVDILIFKYWDVDSDGEYDPAAGDLPLERWRMELYKMDAPGDWMLVATEYTDGDGEALFHVCEAGTYKVVEEDRVGWVHITPTGGEYVFDVLSGDTIELMFGNFECVEILIFKYEDRDSNGEYDNDDVPIPRWEFTVTGPCFDVPLVVWTDENGYASFMACLAGEYVITEEDRDGWTHIDPASGVRSVMVISGMQPEEQMFGNFKDVEIIVFKFDDIFADGQYCPAEGDEPIEGWLIELYYETSPGVWVLVDSALTGPDGYAKFVVSKAGHYKVVEEAVDGWWWILPVTGEYDFWVYSSDILDEFVFANFKMGMIFGYKWNDLDGDGEWDDGEPPLEGWEISFEAIEFYMVGTTTTDSNGYYEFTGLPPGTYIVSETEQEGWVATSDASVEVEIWGHREVRVDFLNFERGCIEGYKYEDMDGDGVLDPEDLPIEGWEIYLSITGWEETPEGMISFITLIATATTDVNGYYRFCGLGPGTYVVSEESRTGWIHTTDPSETVDMTSGGLIPIHDFLNFELGSICGYKFEDLNSNGEWDLDEPAIEGWSIYLDSNGVLDELEDELTYTDENGMYCFDGLEAGTYIVYEIVPDGWVATTPTSHMVEITSGDSETVPDFGNFECVDIIIFKYEDVNGNGVFDNGDVPIEGWEFTVTGPCFDVPLVVLTGGDGYVSVKVCKAGEYTITEEERDGWMHVDPEEGYIDVDILSGDRLPIFRFGNFRLGTIIVTKFYDWDMDGTMDLDEVGLENWVIWLNGTLVDGSKLDMTRQTDSSGEVRFDGLPAGSYEVSERLEYAPPGWEPTTDWMIVVDITSGAQGTVMLGNVLLGDIWGYKFYDKDLDGVRDDGEPGLEGWTILLDGVDDMGNPVHEETRTDETGYYEFVDLHPGVYEVNEELPDTWTATSDLPVEVDFSGAKEEFGKQVDIGNIQYGMIWGYKFQDQYEDTYPFWPNGIFDIDEWGLGNWEITLQGWDMNGDFVDRVVYTDNIDNIGYYEFTKLLPGNYWVNETTLPGWYATTTPVYFLMIPPFPDGQVVFHVDFGNLVPSEDPQMNFVLERGWNLWSTPLIVHGGLTAKGLLEAIGPTGVMVTKIDTASQKWISYVAGDLDKFNFDIAFGEGCYVWVSSYTTFKLMGDLAFHGSVPLAQGWNLMGYTSLKPAMASEVLEMVDGANAVMITYLDAEAGKYISYVKGDAEKFDFVVTPGRAYFIWLDGSGSLVY